MYRHLLAAAIGAYAILPAPASAHGHAPVHSNVVSTFDFRIVLHDGPKVVHHRHPPRGYLRAQPWPPRIQHHSARPRWHQPHRDARHFWRDNDRRHQFKWFRDSDRRQYFNHGQRRGWVHAPGRQPRPHADFKRRNHRSSSHR